jgi:ribosomal protein S18 acetylase RimI-like enzyme
MPITVRQLVAADAAAFRALRLLGLEESPEAFGSSYGSEKDRSVESFARSIADGHITGGFAGDRLVAVAGFYVMAQEKAAHRGAVWGVYVHPEARGQGAATAVLEAVIAHARTRVLQLHLSVTTTGPAVRLYHKLGFVVYGTEPRALCIDGRYFDEHLMVLRLDA